MCLAVLTSIALHACVLMGAGRGFSELLWLALLAVTALAGRTDFHQICLFACVERGVKAFLLDVQTISAAPGGPAATGQAASCMSLMGTCSYFVDSLAAFVCFPRES